MIVNDVTNDYKGKRVAVIGMARTGMAVAAALRTLGAEVTLYDRKPAEELEDSLAEAARLGVAARPGIDAPPLGGADLVIPSPGIPREAPVFVKAREMGIPVLSEIELAYRLSRAPIIAVTGTNGKTTTTVMIGKMLEADGRDTYIAGNVVAGDIRLPLVTAAVRATEKSVIVAEISTFQLEWIESFRPRIGALLNISRDHGDRHTNMDEYADLKASLFRNQRPDDYAIVNADHPLVMERTGGVKSRILPFSRLMEPREGAFVRGEELIVRLDGREVRICSKSEIPVPGEHNVENALAASLAAVAFGAEAGAVAEAIRAFTPIEHRLEPVEEIDGVLYINNSMCTNVDAVVRSIEAIDRPLVVIAGGKDKGSDWVPFAEVVKRSVKELILIGVSAPLIESAVRDAGYTRITNAASMDRAVEAARGLAEPGDAVLLAPGCASFDMFKGFEDRGRVFKSIVRQYQGCVVGSAKSSGERAK
ncbi:MAG: UDP-N-acetylmuramoyl-L-alanine--D-glutamate ligase [Armatimonadota bacterium]|nr:UDP-N-acetylmuramoyl-L-alanine--D-glutamate ligase [Armatimonadota bacterium]